MELKVSKFTKYCDGIWPFAGQRLGKHYLKAGIAAEAEVILLDNDYLAPVFTATNSKEDIHVTRNRITEDI
jgi:hypothetical protein